MKLKLKCGALLAALLLPFAAVAQVKTGPLTLTGTACVSVSVDGMAQIAINVSGGSWSGTIQPKAAIAGQAAANTQVTPSTSSTAASTITANGLYTSTVSGFQTFFLCGNTVTATATIYTVTTTRSAAGHSGSGSGGTGDVTGPGSATADDLASFNGTGGKTIKDSGVPAAQVVTANAPGAGICHFAGSTQVCTSSAVNLASSDVTGVLPGSQIPASIMTGGFSSATPSGTQQFGATYRSTIGAGSTNYSIVPRAITVTGISINLSAAEGAAATLSATLATCTTAACTAFTTTGITCTVGNSAQTCTQTGQSVAVAANALIVIQTVQTGTGTAAVGASGLTYF